MKTGPIKVLIVDDSKTARELLAHLIVQDPALTVVGRCQDGEAALSWLKHNQADVITMDIVMPGIDGFEVTRRIMETQPIPIVIISSVYNPGDVAHAFQAVQAGALAILEKPETDVEEHFDNKAGEIRETLKMIAEVKLVRRRLSRSRGETPSHLESPEPNHETIKAVAIGASLGGPLALSRILSSLSADFPVPIFVVQHIASGFANGFVQWLQEETSLAISLAKDGEIAKHGHCYVAPSDAHMEVKQGSCISLIHAPRDIPQPSVGRLFRSMATSYGANAVGVILSGMGADGAKELLLMRQHGAYTIAQDEESCVMFGMPREAIALGAVKKVLPLDRIADVLMHLVSQHQCLKND